MKLLHVIATRFNLGLYQRKPPDEAAAWMEHRLELFTRFCLPSMLAQQSQDFTWVISVDPATPPGHLARLEEALQGHPRWLVQAVTGKPVSHLADYLAGLAPEPRLLITSRVDNDDAVHRLYAKSLQTMALQLDPASLPLAINFTNGYLVHAPTACAAWVRVNSNPFISLVEAVPAGGRPLTVLARQHLRLNQVAQVAEVGSDPMWMAINHGENISNHMFQVNFRIPLTQVGPDFGIFAD